MNSIAIIAHPAKEARINARLTTGNKAILNYQILDITGDPIDLTNVVLELVIQSMKYPDEVKIAPVTITDAVNSLCQVFIEAGELNQTEGYRVDLDVKDDPTDMIPVTTLARGVWHMLVTPGFPPYGSNWAPARPGPSTLESG